MTTIFIACSRWLRRQGTRQPTSPRAGADEWAALARRASAPQAGDEGSLGSTKDRQPRRTFAGTRRGEPSRDCLHTGQAGRPWPDRSAPACDLCDEATAPLSDHPGSGDAAFAMDTPSGGGDSTMTEGSFKAVDGIKIFTREWQPAGKPRAVVVISHGFNAHSGQYEWVAQQFVSKGLAVHALDHRGHGRSEGERFFIKKFADWTSDLATFIDIVKAREPGLPVFLLGHSAGGVIACGYTLEHQDKIAGLICEDFVPGAGA